MITHGLNAITFDEMVGLAFASMRDQIAGDYGETEMVALFPLIVGGVMGHVLEMMAADDEYRAHVVAKINQGLTTVGAPWRLTPADTAKPGTRAAAGSDRLPVVAARYARRGHSSGR